MDILFQKFTDRTVSRQKTTMLNLHWEMGLYWAIASSAKTFEPWKLSCVLNTSERPHILMKADDTYIISYPDRSCCTGCLILLAGRMLISNNRTPWSPALNINLSDPKTFHPPFHFHEMSHRVECSHLAQLQYARNHLAELEQVQEYACLNIAAVSENYAPHFATCIL